VNRAPKLRIHLVGSDSNKKYNLALSLRKEINKAIGRATIVPDMQQKVEKRMGLEFKNHVYFLALENDYFRYQSDIATKTHHLIFVDSLVDRYLRSKTSSIDMDLYFCPQFKASREGHLFIYGPSFDLARSRIMQKFDVPGQLWTKDCKTTISMLMESIRLRLGVKSSGARKSYS